MLSVVHLFCFWARVRRHWRALRNTSYPPGDSDNCRVNRTFWHSTFQQRGACCLNLVFSKSYLATWTLPNKQHLSGASWSSPFEVLTPSKSTTNTTTRRWCVLSEAIAEIMSMRKQTTCRNLWYSMKTTLASLWVLHFGWCFLSGTYWMRTPETHALHIIGLSTTCVFLVFHDDLCNCHKQESPPQQCQGWWVLMGSELQNGTRKKHHSHSYCCLLSMFLVWSWGTVQHVRQRAPLDV